MKQNETEAKIKEAGRKLFTKNGFAATKTRDIAAEAGINCALLNYYFRSKLRLFNIIMLENFMEIIKGVAAIINDPHTTIDQKVQSLVSLYSDMLQKNPDLPFFVLSELRNNQELVIKKFHSEGIHLDSTIIQQLMDHYSLSRPASLHIVLNTLSLTIFPFIALPIFKKIGHLDHNQFNELIIERKTLIPEWIAQMYKHASAFYPKDNLGGTVS